MEIPIRCFRPRSRWRWWLHWGANETALMYPKAVLTISTDWRIPPGTMLILNPGGRPEYVQVTNLG